MKTQKLFPVCKDYLWGGDKLISEYGKKTEARPCAESWELSFHPDGPVQLEDGSLLSEKVTDADLGVNCKAFPFFPVLNKFIDARANLSVQVHPSDAYALEHENSFGKTEMWMIIEASEGAGIYLGLNRDLSEEDFRASIAENRLTDDLNFIPVKAGDVYFIPSGTIHAIASGCLIYEIQQNSNLTYRVYDYGRVGKDGKPRELHVEKAIQVTNLQHFQPKSVSIPSPDGEIVGMSRYFTAHRLELHEKNTYRADPASFRCFTCVEGNAVIDGVSLAKGESCFVSAGSDPIEAEGEAKLIMTSVRKYYVGIDLGGTFIKGGIVNDLGQILIDSKVPTESDKGPDRVAENIANLAMDLLASLNMTTADVEGIGIGVPGMIDSEKGMVVYSNNLGWKHFAISDKVREMTHTTVKIANDANVAALGEVKFGCAKDFKTVIFLTLGTGVGGGIVIDGKLFEGNRSAGAELGHTGIVAGGELCTCGRRGCLEAYASATALIRETRKAMQSHADSKLWKIGSLDKVNGETAFLYEKEDAYARAVVEQYIEMLGYGMVNFANEYRPEALILGGGVCAQGERLTVPLKKYVAENLFGGTDGPCPDIRIAELGNKAGILGASALLLD